MSRSSQRKKRILIVIDTAAGVSAREVLSGIFKFVNAGRSWALRIIQLPLESLADMRAGISGGTVDGMIVASAADDESNRAIAEARIPVVFVDVRHPLFERLDRRVAFVRNDNGGIGCAGARYLASLGQFNSFGFVPSSNNAAWSKIREQAFVGEIRARGFKAHVFSQGSTRLCDDRNRLIRWLGRMPKPTALMCAYDYRAVQVCEACSAIGLRIPEQVTLLGVDNDELLCLSTIPAISSVRPDHVGEGFQAAVELSRLFRLGTRAGRRETLCPMLGVVERESTKVGPPAATLIRRAVAFIDANAKTNLRVNTIADTLGVSRRLLEKRFREVRGETLHACILARRLEAVKRLLRTTSRPVAKIATECGFNNANALAHIFSRVAGCSMSGYRRNLRHGKPPA